MPATTPAGDLPLVSASQITLYRECKRKWAFRYIAGIETPQHPAAELGTQVDDLQLQPYLRDAKPFDYTLEVRDTKSAEVAVAGLRYLPEPRTLNLEVQKHFVLPAPSKLFGFQGYIDLWLPNGGLPGETNVDTPTVVDFKTTGNWRYRKTVQQLRTDVQAQLYGQWAMVSTGAPVANLDWIYFHTKRPFKSDKTHLRMYREDSDEQFAAINATAEEMFVARKTITDPLALAPNTDACGDYGGCPYQHLCNLSPTQRIDAMAAQWSSKVEVTSMSNTPGPAGLSGLARLRALKQAAESPASAPATIGAAAAAVSQATDKWKDGQAAADAGVVAVAESLVGQFVEVLDDLTKLRVGPAAQLPLWVTTEVDPRAPLGINPPESQLAPAPAVGVTTLTSVEPVAAPAPVAEAPAKRTRGPNKAKPAAVVPVTPGETYNVDVDQTGMLTLELMSAVPAGSSPTGALVTVTWAEETISPVAYNSFKVGPFTATGTVRAGETIPQACGRLYAELAAFAEQARDAKAITFRATLDRMAVTR